MTISNVLRLLCAFVALNAPVPAVASSISVSFSGTIDSSSIGSIGVGDSFTGQMVYETSGLLFGSGPGSTNYGFFQPQDGVSVAVNGFDFIGTSYLNLFLANGPNNASGLGEVNTDFLDGSSDGVFGALSTNYPGLTLTLIDARFLGDLNFLTSYDIPSPFNSGNVIVPGTATNPTGIFVRLSDGGTIHGYIDDVTVTPEPSTLLLAPTFLGGLWYVRSRRKRGLGIPCNMG